VSAAEPPRGLPDLLRRLVQRDPDRVAVIDSGIGPVSRGELLRRTVTLVERLRSAGIGTGDCVAVWLPNWSDALCWQFAVASLGGHVIGVNTRYNLTEVTHVLDTARPALIAVAHRFRAGEQLDLLREAVAASDAPAPGVAVVSAPGAPSASEAELDEYRVGPQPDSAVWASGSWDTGSWATAPGPDSLDPGDPDLVTVAFTTSGSTGLPKLAGHSSEGVLAHALADVTAMGLTESDVTLCAIPLAGAYGFNSAMATIAAGASLLLAPVFEADAALDDMQRYRVTHLPGGDDLVLRLERAYRAKPRDLTSWRWWGAAEFQGRLRELASWSKESFGTMTTGLYGSSEVFALTTMWPLDEPEPRRHDRGGRLVSPEIQVRVVDPESGRQLELEQEGELQFRGPNVVNAYLGNPDAAAKAFTEDGWFRSGDLGFLIPGGGFVHTVRIGDALRLRGFLVDPAEIELRLAEHPEVEIAKVVGIEGADGSARAVGFVVPVAGTEPAPPALRDWCATALAKFKVPEAVHVIDEMPTTSGTNGTKIRAATLREWARERA
jgi:fatty-acyl-CoA synthase